MKKITKTLLTLAAILMIASTIGTSVPTMTTKTETNFNFEQEEYIDDIPFDTEQVILENTFKMEKEEYIDDIPFDTKKVVEGI